MNEHAARSTTALRPKWVPGHLFPFQSHWLEIDGCRVHYVDEGTGPVMLFLHGNPTWSFLYREIVKALRPGFRCIALDYPGFGLSRAREGYGYTPAEHSAVVQSFVSALELQDVTLMVQDWGGPIGLGAASRDPQRFRGLIIANTIAWPINGKLRFEWFSKLMGGRLGGFLIRNFNTFVNVLIPAGVKRNRLPREVMAAYRAPFPTPSSREPTHIFPRELLASRDYLAEVERGLASLRHLPTLILWGDRDLAYRASERARFEELFPNHHTVILEGAGHFLQEDSPDEIFEAISEWWPREMLKTKLRG